MNYSLVFSPEAEEQLAALYRYIASAASPDISESSVSPSIHYVGPKGEVRD